MFFYLDATNITGKLLMWVEWQNDRAKYIDAKEAQEKWPVMVIRFLEGHLVFDD